MKKVLFFALAAGVALAACTKNEVKPVSVDQEITFQTVVNKASTKAMIDGTAYGTTNTFGTVAYLEPAGANSASVYIPTSEVKYNSNHYWSTGTAYYWPVQGSLSFMSYSPYTYQEGSTVTPVKVDHEYNKLKIDNYNVADHQETDLMVADIQKGQKANSTQSREWQKGVPTIFHHKLSQIIGIKFQTVDTQTLQPKDYTDGRDGSENNKYKSGDQQYFINEVSFKDTYFVGSYVYDGTKSTVSESWTNVSSLASRGWYKETTANSDGKFKGHTFNTTNNQNGGLEYLLVLPQTFTNTGSKDQALYIKYTVRTYYKNDVLANTAGSYTDEVIETTIPLYNIHAVKGENNTILHSKWDMNKKITYTISLTKQRIYWDPSVVDWTPESPSVSI